MQAKYQIWQLWASNLHRWGVRDFMASLLEGLGPLSVLGAQMIYLAQPLIKESVAPGHLEALADMLEEPSQRRAFIEYLREASLP